MSDHIIVMDHGDIRQIGTPAEIYTHPTDPFVADFIGDANVMRVSYTGAENGLARYDTDFGASLHGPACDGETPGARVLLLRPEAISVGRLACGAIDPPGVNRVPGRVVSTAYMGAIVEVRVVAGPQQFLVKKAAAQDPFDLRVGDSVVMQWELAAAVVLTPSAPDRS